MSKRNWTNVKAREPLIIAMREAGMTRQEIADELGLTKQRQNIETEVKRLRMENKLLRDFLQSMERK